MPTEQDATTSVAPWVPIAGAGFGALTLIGLFMLTWQAGNNDTFVCNSFTPLTAVFAFGAALAASFIGGAAAVRGQFGPGAQGAPIVIAATGGIAVLFGSLFLFNQFEPSICDRNTAINRLHDEYKSKLEAMKRNAEDKAKELMNQNASLKIDIEAMSNQLRMIREQDIFIAPQAINQLKSLKDKIEIVYFNKKRHEAFAVLDGGRFRVPRNDFDDGSHIEIGLRESARPAESSGPQIVLSRMSYISSPPEVQLFLKIDER